MLITQHTKMETIVCCECQMMFAAPERWVRRRKQTGDFFCCPLGHEQHFTKPENERLKDELARVRAHEDQLRTQNENLRRQTEHAERREAAQKGRVTKLKKRAAAGVCLHCNRTFQQLARHMKSQHPECAEEAKES